jgi:hypothetical protein
MMSIDDVSARNNRSTLWPESSSRLRRFFEDDSAATQLLSLADELAFTATRLQAKGKASGQAELRERAYELCILAVKLQCQALGIRGVSDQENA